VIVALAVLAGLAIAAPHVLRLESAHPATSAAIWFAALSLRALAALFFAVFVVLYLPATALFDLVTHWCWYAVLPVVTTHLGLSGHSIGDVALLAPMLGLAASFMSVSFGLWRATRTIRAWVRSTSIGPGPQHSVIVGEHDVVVAAAGFRRPTVIVSAGALTTFDDEELAASLAHERGHIAHRHRFVLASAETCRSLARLLPGTRRAVAELVFHLERDADRWAIERRHEPTALASAICKAATSSPPMLASLGGTGSTTSRVQTLLAKDRDQGKGPLPGPALALGTVLTVLVLSLAVTLPAWGLGALPDAGAVVAETDLCHPH